MSWLGNDSRIPTPGVLTLGWILVWGPGAGALTSGTTVQLPGADLRFSPIAEIPMLPIPAPDTYVMRWGDDSFEVCDADALWHAGQTSALFTNALGRVTVAQLRALPPTSDYLVKDQYIRRADYARAAVAPERWDNETMGAWIAAFTGEAPSEFTLLGAEQSLRYPTRMYQWESTAPHRRGYLVRLPDPVRFVWFQFELADPDPQVARRAMMQSLRSIVAGTTRAAGKRADPRFQNLAATGGQGGEYEATRQRVIENIQSLDQWWYVELPHYVMVSNLEKSKQRLVKELQTNLEKVREQFVSLWAPVGEIREVSVVRIFNTREEYLDYVGTENQWTTGVWLPSRRELVVSPEHDGVGRGQILNTAYHEAFHQYVYYALEQLRIPTWLNEGHACLFEACRFTNNGRTMHIDENRDRLAYLEVLPQAGLDVDILDLMALSRQAFYLSAGEGDLAERRRGAHYATAWALVYFLRRGAPVAYPSEHYHAIPDRILDYLRRHPNAFDDAMEHALEGIDPEHFRNDYAAFWASKRLRGMAKRPR